MVETTLCYIESDGKYLMINKNKRENDLNKGKWMGLGGHLEIGETPYQCVIREIKEEAGLIIHNPLLRAKIYFINDDYEELMYLYTVSDFCGEIIECNEGILEWIKKEDVLKLNIWEGDKVFLDFLVKSDDYFELKLFYKNDKFVGWERL
jgi:8-oxo-dGTP diphosphatase